MVRYWFTIERKTIMNLDKLIDDKIEELLNNDDYGAFGVNLDTVVIILENLKNDYNKERENEI
jgi:hypothetical protein